MKFLFIVGSNGNASVDALLSQEATQYGDLLRVELQESYRRLVFKTAALYDYLTLRSSPPLGDLSFDYFLKTDDDSFVRIDKLVERLDVLSAEIATDDRRVSFFASFSTDLCLLLSMLFILLVATKALLGLAEFQRQASIGANAQVVRRVVGRVTLSAVRVGLCLRNVG